MPREEDHRIGTKHTAKRAWPSLAFASAQLCRPELRLVHPRPETRLETSAVLSLAALSVADGKIAVDGLLDAATAGTTLDVNGIPIRVRRSGDFSAVFDLRSRRALTVTMTIPLATVAPELDSATPEEAS